MNYIYTSTRDGSRYILDPQATMGSRVCLVNLTTCEDKFVSPQTLKRWYTLTRTEDIFVQVKAFTGMNIGLCIVVPEDVKEKFNQKFPVLGNYRSKGMQYSHDQDAYAQGKRDGRSAMDKRSLPQG